MADKSPKKPQKGDIVLVTKAGIEVAGETEFAAIVTLVFDDKDGTNISATAFPANGYTHWIDAARHQDDPNVAGNSTWRWPTDPEKPK